MTLGLDNQQISVIGAILGHYPEVEKGLLYGSRVKGTHTPRSDIDLALIGTNLDRHTINRIKLELDESDLINLIDVQDYHSINNPRLKSHIDRLGEVIYERMEG